MQTLIDSLHSTARALIVALVAATLGACGGGDAASGNTPPDPAALPEGKAARLEVEPAALMLIASGERRALSVRAFDAEGREIQPRVTWRSTRPEQVRVDTAGQVEALLPVGGTQVIVESDGVEAVPVLVSVVEMAPGVLLIDDKQIVSDPVAVDAAAAPDPDNPFEVLISGITPPAVGSLLLGREGKSVGGEVLAAQAEGSAVRVRLRLVGPSRLVRSAQINEVIDLSRQPLEVPPAVAALYDVTRVDDEYVFTPKPVAALDLNPREDRARALSATGEGGRARPNAETKFVNLGPLECILLTPELPISLAQPSQFSLKFEPKLHLDYDAQVGLRKVLLTGQLGTKIKSSLVLSAAGLLSVGCDVALTDKLVKFPGWVGVILSGELVAGSGFEMEVQASVPLMGLEVTAESKGPFEVGLDCSTGECNVVRNYDPVTTFTPTLKVPGIGALRSEASLFAYGQAKLKMGATFLASLRADVVTARAGVKLEGSFAPPSTQVAPADVDYRSDYKFIRLIEVAAGSTNKAGESAFRKLLQKLGLFKFSTLKTQLSSTLGTSPKGAMTVDRATVVDGGRVNFEIELDPATVDFPFVGYNVQRVRVFRGVPGRPAREVATAEMPPGQLSASLGWVAEGTASEGPGGEFFLFVDTVLPTPFSLELAKAQVVPILLTGQMQVSFVETTATASDSGQSQSVRTVNLATAVEQTADAARLVMVGPAVTASIEASSTSKALIERAPCSWVSVQARQDITRGREAPQDAGNLDFSFVGDTWRLNEISMRTLNEQSVTDRQTATQAKGDCSGSDLSPQTFSFDRKDFLQTLNIPFSATATPWFSGPLQVDAEGRRSLKFSSTSPFSTFKIQDGTVAQTGTLSLDLKEGPPAKSKVDLVLSLLAPTTAEAESQLSYGVKLVNRGPSAATSVRAEFSLPPGFIIATTTGWQGCFIKGLSAICEAGSMAKDEQRSFSIDVKAASAAGVFTVRGRASAAELDSNFSDNHAQAQTEIP